MKNKLMISLILIFAGFNFAAAEDYSKLVIEAEDAFRQALSLMSTNKSKSVDLFRDACDFYNEYFEKTGTVSPALFYNAGNAYFMAGDYGWAIYFFKKGLDLSPGNKDLKFNLNAAREARLDDLGDSEQLSLVKVLLFWHYGLNLLTKLCLVSLFFIAFTVLLLLFILRKRKYLLVTAIVCFSLAAVFTASFLIYGYEKENDKQGVVIANEVILRKGDNNSYQPVFDGPLHSGAEFTLLDIRNGWAFVKIENIGEGWLPENSTVIIE